MSIPIIPLVALLVSVGAAQSGLKIVVIDGENAVNIIQQKTATAPVVEVRDRNNLPVPGAVVTFSVQGGKAALFGSSNTLTLTTNAAGRAVAAGFNPISSGAVQINVSAAFQGQTVAAAITQTNVMTAAEAASAASGASGASSASGASGGSSASGAGAGAGGGMSATTVGIVGAAVAGGAVAATEVVKKKGEGGDDGGKRQTFSGPFSVTATDTLTSRVSGQACTISRSVTGTATFMVDTRDPNSVVGDLNLDGASTVTSFTCVVENPNQRWGTGVKVSGPMSALRGSGTSTNSSTGVNGETITGTQTTSFEGAINGATMTGTVKYELRSQSTGGGGGGVDGFQSTIISLTLTKS